MQGRALYWVAKKSSVGARQVATVQGGQEAVGASPDGKESTAKPKSSDALRSAVTAQEQDGKTQVVGRELDES